MTAALALLTILQTPTQKPDTMAFLAVLQPKVIKEVLGLHINGKDGKYEVRLHVFSVPTERVLKRMATTLTKEAGWAHSSDNCGGVFYDRSVKGVAQESVWYSTVTSAGTCDVRYVDYRKGPVKA